MDVGAMVVETGEAKQVLEMRFVSAIFSDGKVMNRIEDASEHRIWLFVMFGLTIVPFLHYSLMVWLINATFTGTWFIDRILGGLKLFFFTWFCENLATNLFKPTTWGWFVHVDAIPLETPGSTGLHPSPRMCTTQNCADSVRNLSPIPWSGATGPRGHGATSAWAKPDLHGAAKTPEGMPSYAVLYGAVLKIRVPNSWMVYSGPSHWNENGWWLGVSPF